MISAFLSEIFLGIGRLVLKVIYGKRYKEECASKKEKMDTKALLLSLLNVIWLGCLGIGLSQENEYSVIFIAVGVVYPLVIAICAFIARRKKTNLPENNSDQERYVRAPSEIRYKKITFYEGTYSNNTRNK